MFRVTNLTRGSSVGETIELGRHIHDQDVRAARRSGLDAGGGLWIRPSSGVHTFFMRFRIDVIGLDRELKVIKLWRCLAPFRVTSVSVKMHSVIELPCGTIKRSETATGGHAGGLLGAREAGKAIA